MVVWTQKLDRLDKNVLQVYNYNIKPWVPLGNDLKQINNNNFTTPTRNRNQY